MSEPLAVGGLVDTFDQLPRGAAPRRAIAADRRSGWAWPRHAPSVDRVLVALACLGLWQGAHLYAGAYWVPSPDVAASRLVIELQGGWWRHVLFTATEAIAGLAVGAAAAGVAALALGRHTSAIRVLDPLLRSGYTLPKVALAPLFVVWFGTGAASTIAVVALSSFFIVYFNALAGIESVPPRLIRAAELLGARHGDLARKVVWPYALPHLLAGVRVAWPYSVGGAVVTELMSASAGLGYVMQLGASTFDNAAVFAALIAIAVVVAAGTLLIDRYEAAVSTRSRVARRAAHGGGQ